MRPSSSAAWCGTYLNGQGATARKLEPDRFRRTTEGGGPRKATFDAAGLRALSLNEAARIRHTPQHFLADQRPEMLAWLRVRNLPCSDPRELGQDGPFSKWPPEIKPRLRDVMRGMAVLRRAAEFLGEALYIFGDDAKDYFNQLAMAGSELHKLGIGFLGSPTATSCAPQARRRPGPAECAWCLSPRNG